MNSSRFNALFSAAKSVRQSINARGFIRRNALPLVSVFEHDWLVKNGYANLAKFTRIFEYHDAETMGFGKTEYIEDVNRPASAQKPQIREIWIGSRSLGSVNLQSCEDGEDAFFDEAENPDEQSDNLALSRMEQEDAAEETELATQAFYFHHDESKVPEELRANRFAHFLYHHGSKGIPLIEDETTGLLRPVRIGDTISIVRGSNDDLDALFLEEADDPRAQNDASAGGSDHRWSDRFSANRDWEHDLLNERRRKGNEREGLLCSHPALEAVTWNPTELQIRRAAGSLVDKVLTRRPEWADQAPELTRKAEQGIKRMLADPKWKQGQMVQGHMMTKDEIYGTIEANLREFEKCTAKKARPVPIDFDAIREPQVLRARKLEQRRNEMRAQLVPPAVAKTGRHK